MRIVINDNVSFTQLQVDATSFCSEDDLDRFIHALQVAKLVLWRKIPNGTTSRNKGKSAVRRRAT